MQSARDGRRVRNTIGRFGGIVAKGDETPSERGFTGASGRGRLHFEPHECDAARGSRVFSLSLSPAMVNFSLSSS